jgi:hypothetical protein
MGREKLSKFEKNKSKDFEMTVCRDVAPCSPVEVYQSFRRDCCLIGLMMEAASTSETSVNFYQNTRCNIPEDNLLQIPGLTTNSLTYLSSRTILV